MITIDSPISSKEDLKIKIKKQFTDIKLDLDTHNTTSFIVAGFKDHEPILVKAEFGFDRTLDLEIEWYKKYSKDGLTANFIFYEIQDSYSYFIIEYLSNSLTFDNYILSNQYEVKKANNTLIHIVKNVKQIYNDSKLEVDKGYIHNQIRSKILTRTNQIPIKQLPWIQKRKLIINEEEYLNPLFEIDTLLNHKITDLIENNIGYSHSDLHLSNILKDEKTSYLIDPKLRLLPITYDYGKLFHSLNGKYQLIINKKIEAKLKNKHITFNDSTKVSDRYENIFNVFKKTLTDKEILLGYFFEINHFLTMLPHHYNDENEFLTLFTNLTILYDRFKKNYAIN